VVTDWRGKVSQVDNEAFSSSSYIMTIDMGEPFGSPGFDVKVPLSQQDALTVSKDQNVTLSGTIVSVECVLTYCPIELENVIYSLR
jgi:hypothetical protein